MPDPWRLFVEAQKGLPTLKWALGVAAIVALIAIVTVGWKVNPRIAVFGTIIMLVLMVLLVIFARLAVTAATEFRTAVLVFMWGSLVLTMATAFLLFTSVFFGRPLNFESPGPTRGGVTYAPAAGDPKVWDVQDRINALRGSWETVVQYGEGTRRDVLARATRLASEMMAIDDATLGPSGAIIKFEYACYAFVMKADTENTPERRRESALEAVTLCDKAASAIDSTKSKVSPSTNERYVSVWIEEENEEAFTNYVLAMAHCLAGTGAEDAAARMTVGNVLNRIPSHYLNKYPPDRDRILKACVNS